ncbi:MAG: Smr/MutS family protein [Acetobacteraceae bacterium]
MAIGQAPPGLDRASWRRFSSGQFRAALTLDLHGMTAAEAASALEEFLQGAAVQGHRTVEVITGRGTGPQGGVIRREFAHWLNGPSLRPLLLGACHPARTNLGSVRLLLRKHR